MPKYIFSNLIGAFVFDEKLNLDDSILFKNLEEYENKSHYEEKLIKKYNLEKPKDSELKNILHFLKNKKYFSEFYNKNLLLTKKQIKNSVNEDLLIIQAVSSIEETDKVIYALIKRLREWYELYNPEFSKSIKDNEKFIELISNKTKKDLLKEINIDEQDSMGASLSDADLKPIMFLAKRIAELYKLKESNKIYLQNLMKKCCPNLVSVAGFLLGAKLIRHTGSLKRLVQMPASTIQILGAEKALFRHIKNKKFKAPRHGLIIEHHLIAKAPQKMHGKTARALADKISLAVKVDYFKGKFIGDKLKQELEEKFRK